MKKQKHSRITKEKIIGILKKRVHSEIMHKKKLKIRVEDKIIRDARNLFKLEKAFVSRQKLNRRLIEIQLHMNIMVLEIKHCQLMNTKK